jgi:hypothetical protein
MAESSDSKPAVADSIANQETTSDAMIISTDTNGEEAPKPSQEAASTEVVMRKEQENGLLDAKIPAKKDATLREFISKMDEHAPIVRWRENLSIMKHERDTNQFIDTRCCCKLLPHTRGLATSTSYTTPTCPPPRPRNTKVHCRRGC